MDGGGLGYGGGRGVGLEERVGRDYLGLTLRCRSTGKGVALVESGGLKPDAIRGSAALDYGDVTAGASLLQLTFQIGFQAECSGCGLTWSAPNQSSKERPEMLMVRRALR